MGRPKVYESKAWLWKKYRVERLTEAEIAKQAGVTQPTINRWLVKHGLKRAK